MIEKVRGSLQTRADGVYASEPEPNQKRSDVDVGDAEGNAPVKKVDIWMRNLLDLSKRNAMISYRLGVRAIQLDVRNLTQLEDALSKNESFALVETLGNARVARKNNRMLGLGEVVGSEASFKAKKIHTFFEAEELDGMLKNIYRDAGKAIEESGASTLFLAMGFLRWTDQKDSVPKNQPRPSYLSPLVLLPIELLRKNYRHYQIRIRDEEPQMNITLLEMLKQKFDLPIDGLHSLPEDESGVDLAAVFERMRLYTKYHKDWEVLETAVLGHFSFAQFVMWNDLKDRFDQLTENHVVRGLVEGFYDDESARASSQVGEHQASHDSTTSSSAMQDLDSYGKDLVIPSEVDSSQLSAVIAASEGTSFVLHGPPGTGKSQTITNMIANALYQGKSVLFVAEKMAALNVVYERLEKIGLGDFCLEIHSNKTSKRVVMDKLEQTAALAKETKHPSFKRKNERLNAVQKQLNEELFELHRVQLQGFSAYDLISLRDQAVQPKRRFPFGQKELSGLNPDAWEMCYEAMGLLQKALQAMNTPFHEHPFNNVTLSSFHPAELDAFFRTLTNLVRALTELSQLELASLKQLHLGHVRLLAAVQAVVGAHPLPIFLSEESFSAIVDPAFSKTAEHLLQVGERYQRTQKLVLSQYRKEVVRLDIVSIKAAYLAANASLILGRGGRVKKALLPLNALALNGHQVTDKNANEAFDLLFSYVDQSREWNESMSKLRSLLGMKLPDEGALSLVESLQAFSIGMRAISSQFREAKLRLYPFYQKTRMLESEGKGEAVTSRIIKNIEDSTREVDEMADCGWMKQLDQPGFAETMLRQVRTWSANRAEAKDLVLIFDQFAVLRQQGLTRFADWLLGELRAGTVQIERLQSDYLYSVTTALAKWAIGHSEPLQSFHSMTTEERIGQYNTLVDQLEVIGRGQVRNALIKRLPNNRELTNDQKKAYAALKRVIRSKGRGMPIRKIFKEYGGMIKTITPCMLMSPLSVAQYIDLEFPKFDLVIFDEASQIRTSVAVGAMSRAKECVIVGDPNQMPPTAFFASQTLDEENILMEDLESLLEDCLAINMPQKYLTCHYRSESESLIAFSNRMYYKNRMVTFPSPHDGQSTVSFHPVEGIYERGGSRTNKGEAHAIVQEILRRLSDPVLAQSTIGVVTFNVSQQELIDDLLQHELAKNDAWAEVAESMREQIFIKNLENVQGDERDVILFSVTYGKDENGKFLQNFGPLSKKGGWRRLNVAASRARKEMLVFSGITHDEFQITPSTSEGVFGLSRFLEYAQKGISALRTQTDNPRNDMLLAIQSHLRANGFVSELYFGTSSLSIELVVRNPRLPEQYLCAVLFDGRQSVMRKTARDRNRLIPKILEKKGWKLYRIWALDYFENKEKVLGDFVNYLRDLLDDANKNTTPQPSLAAPAPVPRATKTATTPAVAKAQETKTAASTTVAKAQETKTATTSTVAKSAPAAKPVTVVKAKTVSQTQKLERTRAQQSSKWNDTVYTKYGGTEKYRNFSINQINPKVVLKLAEEIVEVEAPIKEDLLMRRIVEQLRDGKLTENMRIIISKAIEKLDSQRVVEQGETIYFGSIDPKTYKGCRMPNGEEYVRKLDSIPLCEIANRMRLYMLAGIREDDDLIRETVNYFGFIRVTINVQEIMLSAKKMVGKLPDRKATAPPRIVKEKNLGSSVLKFDDLTSFVAFDLETTGFSNDDEIIEIGAIKIVNGRLAEGMPYKFQEFVKPATRPISWKITEVTGIRPNDVVDARGIQQVFQDFMEFVGDLPLIGYNSEAFDKRFLMNAAQNCGVSMENDMLDVMHYASNFTELLGLEKKKVKLEVIAEQLGIQNSQAHRALADAVTTARVFLALKGMKHSNNSYTRK